MTDGRAQNWGVEWAACGGGRPDCQHCMSLSRRPVGTAVTQVTEAGDTKAWQGGLCPKGWAQRAE